MPAPAAPSRLPHSVQRQRKPDQPRLEQARTVEILTACAACPRHALDRLSLLKYYACPNPVLQIRRDRR